MTDEKHDKEITEWYIAVEEIKTYVVRISTPSGSGTGFLFVYTKGEQFCGIATAAHVINYAHHWKQPRIRVGDISVRQGAFSCVGLVHGTFKDPTGGKFAAIVPSSFIYQALELAAQSDNK